MAKQEKTEGEEIKLTLQDYVDTLVISDNQKFIYLKLYASLDTETQTIEYWKNKIK